MRINTFGSRWCLPRFAFTARHRSAPPRSAPTRFASFAASPRLTQDTEHKTHTYGASSHPPPSLGGYDGKQKALRCVWFNMYLKSGGGSQSPQLPRWCGLAACGTNERKVCQEGEDSSELRPGRKPDPHSPSRAGPISLKKNITVISAANITVIAANLPYSL